MADQVGIKIEFYTNAFAATSQSAGALGKLLDSHEDFSTSTSLELAGVPGKNAELVRITAVGKDHYVQINSTGASTASNRVLVQTDSTLLLELPAIMRSTAKSIAYRTST